MRSSPGRCSSIIAIAVSRSAVPFAGAICAPTWPGRRSESFTRAKRSAALTRETVSLQGGAYAALLEESRPRRQPSFALAHFGLAVPRYETEQGLRAARCIACSALPLEQPGRRSASSAAPPAEAERPPGPPPRSGGTSGRRRRPPRRIRGNGLLAESDRTSGPVRLAATTTAPRCCHWLRALRT